ncbi:MAG: CDP-alcohol phosphatidyltransferase family protein [Clostridiaceae bacterium]
MFIGKYNGSVILTYIGVLFGVTGIYFSLTGQLDQAMISLIIAGLCDLFDGSVARRFKRDAQELEFGKEIDALADTISFLALPLVLGLVISGSMVLPVIVYGCYVIAGIIRLAYFNITGVEETTQGRNYHGLPVTYAALIFPLIYLPLSFLPAGILSILWPVSYLLVAAAFVIDLRIPKPDQAMNIKLVALAAGTLLLYGLAVVYR